MSQLKEGTIVEDGDGTKGRVLRVVHIPSQGKGHAPREEIYVDWFVGNSQKKHG